MKKNTKVYIISVLIALGVGILSAFLTMRGMRTYSADINQPALAPPMWLFPIVWTVLFILMGISSAAVYTKRRKSNGEIGGALRIYALQLAVNFFWSIVFFNFQKFLFAFIWLCFLWILIVIMIIRFYRLNRVAAYLQIPYLLWVTFAGYLNLMVYFLNR